MVIAYVAALFSAVCYGLGSVLQSIGAKRVEAGAGIDLGGLSKIAAQGPFLAGLGLDALGWLTSLVALFRLPLFVVQAVVAGSVGFVVIVSAVFEHIRPTRRQVSFIVVLCVGLVGLAAAGAPEAATTAPGWFAGAMWAGVAVIAVAGFFVPRLLSTDVAASVLGALAGLAFGGTALCARSFSSGFTIHDALHPLAWALVAYGVIGMVLFATALQRGAVTVTTAWLFTAETLAPALIGMWVLGDHARPGLALLAVASFVVTVGAAVGLTLVSPPME